MFDLDEFIKACEQILAESDPRRAIREVLDPDGLRVRQRGRRTGARPWRAQPVASVSDASPS